VVKEEDVIKIFLGAPYKHRGRTIAGLDCWGLIKLVYSYIGYKVWDIEDYSEDWSFKGRDYFAENYYKEWDRVQLPTLFDVVLFKNGEGIANHGGVILKNGRFIHCSRKTSTVITRLSHPTWEKRIEGFYHLKKRNDNS